MTEIIVDEPGDFDLKSNILSSDDLFSKGFISRDSIGRSRSKMRKAAVPVVKSFRRPQSLANISGSI